MPAQPGKTTHTGLAVRTTTYNSLIGILAVLVGYGLVTGQLKANDYSTGNRWFVVAILAFVLLAVKHNNMANLVRSGHADKTQYAYDGLITACVAISVGCTLYCFFGWRGIVILVTQPIVLVTVIWIMRQISSD